MYGMCRCQGDCRMCRKRETGTGSSWYVETSSVLQNFTQPDHSRTVFTMAWCPSCMYAITIKGPQKVSPVIDTIPATPLYFEWWLMIDIRVPFSFYWMSFQSCQQYSAQVIVCFKLQACSSHGGCYVLNWHFSHFWPCQPHRNFQLIIKLLLISLELMLYFMYLTMYNCFSIQVHILTHTESIICVLYCSRADRKAL